jgi:hypothetical protein
MVGDSNDVNRLASPINGGSAMDYHLQDILRKYQTTPRTQAFSEAITRARSRRREEKEASKDLAFARLEGDPIGIEEAESHHEAAVEARAYASLAWGRQHQMYKQTRVNALLRSVGSWGEYGHSQERIRRTIGEGGLELGREVFHRGKSYQELQREERGIGRAISERREELYGHIMDRDPKQAEKAAIGISELESRYAPVSYALEMARKEGRDPQDMYLRSRGILGTTKERIGEESAIRGVMTEYRGKGKESAIADIDKSIDKLIKSIAGLEKGASDASKSTDEYAKTIEKISQETEELDKLEKKRDIAQRKLPTGGGFGQLMTGVATGGRTISDIIREFTLGVPLEQLTAGTRMVDITNQKYDLLRRAAGGDQTAELILGSISKADRVAKEVGEGVRTAVKVGQGADVVQTAASLKAVIGGETPFGWGNDTGEALKNVAQSSANALKAGLTTTAKVQDAIASTWNAMVQQIEAIAQIPGRLRQAAYNQVLGIAGVSAGIGGPSRDVYTKSFTNTNWLTRLQEYGIDPKKARLYQENMIREQGGDVAFGSTKEQMNMIARMGRYSGIYQTDALQMFNRFAGVGDVTPYKTAEQLVGALQGKGFSTGAGIAANVLSKTVETFAASSVAARAGENVTPQITELLTRIITTHDPGRASVAEAKAAASIYSTINERLTSNDYTLLNMSRAQEFTELASKYLGRGADPRAIKALTTMDPGTLNKLKDDLKGRNWNAARATAEAAGVLGLITDEKGKIRAGAGAFVEDLAAAQAGQAIGADPNAVFGGITKKDINLFKRFYKEVMPGAGLKTFDVKDQEKLIALAGGSEEFKGLQSLFSQNIPGFYRAMNVAVQAEVPGKPIPNIPSGTDDKNMPQSERVLIRQNQITLGEIIKGTAAVQKASKDALTGFATTSKYMVDFFMKNMEKFTTGPGRDPKSTDPNVPIDFSAFKKKVGEVEDSIYNFGDVVRDVTDFIRKIPGIPFGLPSGDKRRSDGSRVKQKDTSFKKLR